MIKTHTLLHFSSVLGILAIFTYVGLQYTSLPQEIPIHFDFSGVPDDFGSKKLIWALPILSVLLYFLLRFSAKNKNFPLLNASASVKKNPLIAKTMIYTLLLVSVLIFSNMTYESIAISRGEISQLSHISDFLIMSIFVIVFGFSWYANKVKN